MGPNFRSAGKSAPSSVSSLPVDLSTFVGRTAELDRIRSILAGARLLTLTGAGGSGKTRLALEAVRSGVEGGVVWVDLTALADPALLAQHVGEAAGFSDEIRTPRALAGVLGGSPKILVLDNCEHLVEACAEIASSLLQACPQLTILATSREALGVRGERAWLVPPLGLPDPYAREEDVGASEAVRLFVDRAQEVAPHFVPDADDVATIAAICHALDGIPLAIELAAARVRVLSLGQILERLGASLDLLTSGRRTSLPRHRTLRAALDWSYDLLPLDRRILLHRLAVFRGGTTLDAVEAVCGSHEPTDAETLDALASLVDRSLVEVREENGQARYRLLETVRQYALERLDASSDGLQTRRRHAAYFAGVVAMAEPHLTLPTRPVWLARLLAELDNLREALTWTREHAPEDHVVLVGRLWWFWFSTRHWAEGARWIDGALALPAARVPGRARAALLFARGALLTLQAHTDEPRPLLEEAIRLAEDAGDARLAAYARNYLGMSWAGEGRPEALTLCREAEAWFRAHDDLYGLRLALLLQGSAAMGAGNLDEAKRLNREGVEVARLFGLGRELAISLQNLAAVHLRSGEYGEARRLVLEALAASSRDPSYYFISIGIAYLGETTGRRGDPVGAARLFGCAEALADTIGVTFFKQDRDRWEEAIPAFRRAAGEEAFDRAREAGRRVTSDEVIAEALAELEAGAPGGGEDEVALPDAGAAAGLAIRLLGGLRVAVAGEPVPFERWTYAKPRELLALLALHPAGVTRDHAARLLWPDAAPSRLKNSFHVTLHHLRKTLGDPGWVVQEGDRYRLQPEQTVRVDALEFEAAAARGLDMARRWHEAGDEAGPSEPVVAALRACLDLYGGHLADESGAVWMEDTRDRLRRRAVDVGLALGRILELIGRADLAADPYELTIGLDPAAEGAHRGLMPCWAAAGERAKALAHFAAVQDYLRATLGVEPDPETQALADSLR